MTRLLATVLMILSILGIGQMSFAVEATPYQAATLLEAQSVSGVEGIGAPCFRITIQLRDVLYVTQQCSTFYWNSYAPSEFVENDEIQVRFEKDKMFMKRPNGKEVKARVMRRVKLQGLEDTSETLRSIRMQDQHRSESSAPREVSLATTGARLPAR